MFQRYNREYSTSFIHIAHLLVCHIDTDVHLWTEMFNYACILYIIFVTQLPALSLHPFELSSLCSGNPIPVNHQVINDHFFPAEYGWLSLTLRLDLAHTDRQMDRHIINKLSWTGTVSFKFSLKKQGYLSWLCSFCYMFNRSEDQSQDSWAFSRIWLPWLDVEERENTSVLTQWSVVYI